MNIMNLFKEYQNAIEHGLELREKQLENFSLVEKERHKKAKIKANEILLDLSSVIVDSIVNSKLKQTKSVFQSSCILRSINSGKDNYFLLNDKFDRWNTLTNEGLIYYYVTQELECNKIPFSLDSRYDSLGGMIDIRIYFSK